MALLQKDYFSVEYDEEGKSLILTWSGFLRSHQFRKGYVRMLKLFKHYEINKLISNTKYLLVVGEKDINWVVKNINPVLIKNGVTHLAFVTPESLFTRWSIENLVSKSEDDFKIEYFNDVERALLWAQQNEIKEKIV